MPSARRPSGVVGARDTARACFMGDDLAAASLTWVRESGAQADRSSIGAGALGGFKPGAGEKMSFFAFFHCLLRLPLTLLQTLFTL